MKKTDVVKSLLAQLRSKGKVYAHYEDLISDYMSLWDTKKALIRDIKSRGIVFKTSSASGYVIEKNNPSVKELVLVNKQMLQLLKELKLSTDEKGAAAEDDL